MREKQILQAFIKQHRWGYTIGIITLVISSFISLAIPKIIGIIMDGLNKKNMQQQEIYRYVLIMLGIAVAVFLLKYVWRYFLIGNCRNLECYLRAKLFSHLQTLPVNFYSNKKTGDLIAYAINDIQAVRITFGFGFVAILEGVLVNTVSIFFMAKTINPTLTLIALGPIPVIVFVMVNLGKLVQVKFRKVQEAFAAISEKVQENISGIRVIKAFSQENEEVESFINCSRQRVDSHLDLVRVSAMLGPITQICFGISFMLFIIYGSRLVADGTISIGDYIAFNTYIIAIMGPVMNISRIIEVWQRGLASVKRLDEIFSAKSDIEDNELDSINEIKGKVEVRNLSFSYPGTSRKALKNIDISIPEGKTLGILGRTGSGKTTLVNLLLRLYNVEDGCILIDGTDINNIPVDILRENIGYVPQDNFLFSTTIRSNIEFFRNIYSEYDVEQATRAAGVYDNILAFAEGFQTVVGEKGVTLSGGQKQRISIARAIIKEPSILILDDSLSAVDTKTEGEILENIKKILRNRTGIIISHRVSTVMHADEIIFMDKGRIVERGTHQELMDMKGFYFELYKMQSGKQHMQNEEGIVI